MGKRRWFPILIVVVCLLLCGCRNKQNNSSDTPTSSLTPTSDPSKVINAPERDEIEIYPTSYPTSNCVTWALSSFLKVPKENLAEINRILYERGLDCQIQFVKTGYVTGDEYTARLEECNRRVKLDIASTGVCYGGEIGVRFLEKYFTPLNDYLNAEDAAALRNMYIENEWEQAEANGKIYAVPRATYYGYYAGKEVSGVDYGVHISINNDYLEYFSGFDGTYASLKKIYEAIGDKNLHIVIDGYGEMILFGLLGYSYYSQLPYNTETSRVENIFSTDKLPKLLDELYADFSSGLLVNGELSTERPEKILAEIHISGIVPGEGFTERFLADVMYESNFGYKTGIYAESSQKDLAFRILSICLSDPDILCLLNPGAEKEVIEKRTEILSENPKSPLSRMIQSVSEEKGKVLGDYERAFILLLGNLYVRPDPVGKPEYVILNPDWDIDAAWKEFCAKTEHIGEVCDELNEEIAVWVEKQED